MEDNTTSTQQPTDPEDRIKLLEAQTKSLKAEVSQLNRYIASLKKSRSAIASIGIPPGMHEDYLALRIRETDLASSFPAPSTPKDIRIPCASKSNAGPISAADYRKIKDDSTRIADLAGRIEEIELTEETAGQILESAEQIKKLEDIDTRVLAPYPDRSCNSLIYGPRIQLTAEDIRFNIPMEFNAGAETGEIIISYNTRGIRVINAEKWIDAGYIPVLFRYIVKKGASNRDPGTELSFGKKIAESSGSKARWTAFGSYRGVTLYNYRFGHSDGCGAAKLIGLTGTAAYDASMFNRMYNVRLMKDFSSIPDRICTPQQLCGGQPHDWKTITRTVRFAFGFVKPPRTRFERAIKRLTPADIVSDICRFSISNTMFIPLVHDRKIGDYDLETRNIAIRNTATNLAWDHYHRTGEIPKVLTIDNHPFIKIG